MALRHLCIKTFQNKTFRAKKAFLKKASRTFQVKISIEEQTMVWPRLGDVALG